MTRLMAGCVRQTESPAKRPESNPDVSATTTDRKHHQQKLKRPQEQRQDNKEPKAAPTAEPTIRTETVCLLTRYLGNKPENGQAIKADKRHPKLSLLPQKPNVTVRGAPPTKAKRSRRTLKKTKTSKPPTGGASL
ncbi:MAG: hypothetical protein PHT85_10635 [Methylovulum sp.]|nr:hypothetical protein [Methylovulum sp.]